MRWGKPNGALVGQVHERQRKTIETYAIDPDLLQEHVGMEDNFQAGGYGERQIEELLQNAVDQLVEPGRVELRLVDGVLYCANEGLPFAAEGIRAVTHAFLSSKKEEEQEKIGRFGLGFKSVLGVTDRPQILSRSISFGFNEPEANELLANLPERPDRVPTLRVPSVLDADAVAEGDSNVAELMQWATTIIRLPLTRGGGRLRQRLQDFDIRYLLFPENLARVDIVLGSGAGSRKSQTYQRRPGVDEGLVELESPTGARSAWRLLRRDHKVSDSVMDGLPGLFRRERVTVSYALEQGKSGVGAFWAWFPLRDQTTASGIFNAPWQVNDDRTSMLSGSGFNAELLDVAAQLLIDAALMESTPNDPAKHFDVLPARGRETRSAADAYLSARVPQLARRNELIPTSVGARRSPRSVTAPIVVGQNRFALPSDVVRRWAELTGAEDAPHWSCYSTPTRAARLAQLLTDEDDKVACRTLSPTLWLTKAASARTLDSVDGALSIYLRLREEKEELWSQFRTASVIPVEGGSFRTIADAGRVLLPVGESEAPKDITLVDPKFADDLGIRDKLAMLGVREVSRDQVALAAAASVRADWSDAAWEHFWQLIVAASPAAGAEALDQVKARDVQIKVPTKSGDWREASKVFRDPALVPGLPARQPDFSKVGGRADLLTLAGCLDDMGKDRPITHERAFKLYAAEMQEGATRAVAKQFGKGTRCLIRFGDLKACGPIDLVLELSEAEEGGSEAALAHWSARLLDLAWAAKIEVDLEIKGRSRLSLIELEAPELWCVRTFGLLETSLGLRRPSHVLSSSMSRFGDMLPVALESFIPVFNPPDELRAVPVTVLEAFLKRDDYQVREADLVAELLAAIASHEKFANVASIPAIDPTTDRVRLTPVSGVVLASRDELDDLGSHSLRYLPSGSWDDALVAAWSLQRAAEVVARSIDWIPAGDAVPLLDVYPTLANSIASAVEDVVLMRCDSIVRRTASPSGVQEQRLSSHLDHGTVLVDSELDDVDTLVAVGRLLRLGLTEADAANIVKQDSALRRSKLIQQVEAEPDLKLKLLLLLGREQLAENLPRGLLGIIEQRQGTQPDVFVAELFLNTYGNEALRRLREPLAMAGLPVPRQWAGTPDSERFVTSLGFPRAFAGTREKKAPSIELVPGRVELSPLHDFQVSLREQIRELVLIRDKDGNHRRGLLYLPTGAGKTRVTTESIVAMLRDEELASPVLWIAQSEELCEQAILSWTEVWRAIGDERPLEVSRYWGGYEVDESLQELQVVVATDAKLASMIDRESTAHQWLRESKVVIIDEAHTAGSPTYTKILTWLGIARDARGTTTQRPLLGLTATPYRGTNRDVNKQFVARFGERRLNALDADDPIGTLRDMKVLSEVEHQLLDGIIVNDSPTEGPGGAKAWDDVSRAILTKLGESLDRTQLLVDHIMRQDEGWPILVFTPTVVSAHVTAALIRSLGRTADAVDGEMRGQERRKKIDAFKSGDVKVLVNCDLLTQGFDAPKVRALYIARPTFSPNRYVQMVGRGLRGPRNGGTEKCLVVNMVDTFTQFERSLAYTEFDHLWTKTVVRSR